MRPPASPRLGCAVALLASILSAFAAGAPPPTADPLSFDAPHKHLVARAGDTNATATFTLTNTSRAPVVIHDIVPSCGCSLATFPAKPWPLPPATRGTFTVATDLRGKSGSLLKTVVLQTSVGARQLTYQIDIPESAHPAERARNQALAQANRQAIFAGDCARCHATPAQGLLGQQLYAAACAICHEASPRAPMVPDLRALNKATSRLARLDHARQTRHPHARFLRASRRPAHGRPNPHPRRLPPKPQITPINLRALVDDARLPRPHGGRIWLRGKRLQQFKQLRRKQAHAAGS